MCPECFALVPMVLATQAKAAQGHATQPPPPAGHDTLIVKDRSELPTMRPTEASGGMDDGDMNATIPQSRLRGGATKSADQPVAPPTHADITYPAPARPRPATSPAPPADESLFDVFESENPAPSATKKPDLGSSSAPKSVALGREDHEAMTLPGVAARAAGGSSKSFGSTPTHGGDIATIPAARGVSKSGGAQGDSAAGSGSSLTEMAAGGKQDPHGLVGRTLGGYRIEKLLGAGGMGAVYLAHQISLDRKVAFKILPARFAGNADLLARFTREALSAAQLSHHNVVQVFDIGSTDDVNFITMELVKGQSLGDMIKKDGRFTVDDAAGFVLQAARGLHYAHERGIIHRDIKPDNLMVNEHGIVKIADMGLAKMVSRPDSDTTMTAGQSHADMHKADTGLTMASVAMGTPAYMAPEQGLDASKVDSRADQYSLGCTLYYLIAGKAPYQGTTAFELITKHRTEPLTPIDTFVKGVPAGLKKIIERMLEKEPAKRFPTLLDAGKEIEAYLGVDSEQGPYKPREHHLRTLDVEKGAYNEAPSQTKRHFAVLGWWIALPLVSFWFIFFGRDFAIGGGILGLTLLTPLANFIIDGVRNKTYLFRRVRSVFFGMPLKSWAMAIGGGILALGALHILGLLFWWIGFGVVAIGVAAAYQLFVVTPLKRERAPSIAKMNELLRELRLKGVSEEALQDFICRFAGKDWQEFFEEFFSYEDALRMRLKWAQQDLSSPRKRFAVWRDPLARWLVEIEESRKRAREQRTLARAETLRLKSIGMSDKEAQKKAEIDAKKALKEMAAQKKAADKADKQAAEAFAPAKRKGFSLPGAGLYAWVRLGAGAWVTLAGATKAPLVAQFLPPTFIALGAPYLDWYYKLGQGHTIYAVGAGVALLLSGLTKRVLMPTLVLVGTIGIAGMDTIVKFAKGSGQAIDPMMLFWGSVGLVALGLAGTILMGKKDS